MKRQRQGRPAILERRRVKRGAKEAELSQERAREQARARRELAKKHVLVNPENLHPTNSYGTPDFVKRGYYVDMAFNCKFCGAAQVWSETQQKWWYESAKGDVWTKAVLCRHAGSASRRAVLQRERSTSPGSPPSVRMRPNPSIERTSSSKLRLLPAAAHVER